MVRNVGRKTPLAVEPFEYVDTAILEAQATRLRDRARDLGHEDLIGRGGAHDPRRLVHRDAADIAVDELDLAEVDAGTHAEPVALRATPNRRRAPQRLARTVEGGEQPVARRLDLLTPVSLELCSGAYEVLGDERPPARVSELRRPRRRVHEVREEERGENAAPAPDQEAVEEGTVPGEHDLNAGLVADDIAVVPGRDLERVVGSVHDLRSVGVERPQPSREYESHVPDLTPIPSDTRAYVLRPTPPGLRGQLAERHVTELQQLDGHLRKPKQVVRRREVLDSSLCHV